MPQLKRYRVHIYAIVRVPIEIANAESVEDALEKADTIFSGDPEKYIFSRASYADDVESFLVDELNAENQWDEHCKSTAFDKEKRRQ